MRKSRMMAIVMVLVVVVGFAGCGKKEKATEEAPKKTEEKVYEPPKPDEPPVMPGLVPEKGESGVEEPIADESEADQRETVTIALPLDNYTVIEYGRVVGYMELKYDDVAETEGLEDLKYGLVKLEILGKGGEDLGYTTVYCAPSDILSEMIAADEDNAFEVKVRWFSKKEGRGFDIIGVVLEAEEVAPEDIPAWGF